MIRLSIIIPFYNVEQYIAQCLDSVFDQDIPEEEYEVICVNDGSPDHSREIVLDYMKRHSNLHLIEHECNKKLGAARNTGRRAAKGKYIWNVDSDDAIEKKCLGQLLDDCERDDLEVLMFGYSTWDGTQGIKLGNNLPCADKIMRGIDYMCLLDPYHLSFLCPVWNKIIKKDFLDKENIYSPEINMGEDVPYSFRVISRANTFRIVTGSFYLYRLNPISLTGKDTIPTAQSLYEKCVNNSKMIVEVVDEISSIYSSVKNSLNSVASYTLQTMFPLYEKMTTDDKKIFKSFLIKRSFVNLHIFKLLKVNKSLKYLAWLFM